MECILNRLTDEDKAFYNDISAPKPVAIPPMDAWNGLCVLKDGRIRHYGTYPRERSDNKRESYIESLDGGLSWKDHILPEGALGNSFYFEDIDKYCHIKKIGDRFCYVEGDSQDEEPDKIVELPLEYGDISYGLEHLIKLEKRNRIGFMTYFNEADKSKGEIISFVSYYIYSDDRGETWNRSRLKPWPYVQMKEHDKGARWQNQSCEPSYIELSDGTLFCLARTSENFFVQYYSYDGGESWTEPELSKFHAFTTKPNLYKLSDGRIILTWSNSMPLSETDHSEESISDDSAAVAGVWEDVFTNRDMLNLAISDDDGKTWKSYRELMLNDLRNSNYFRSQGGIDHLYDDKSCHQSQVLEMPLNKLLVSIGQHDVLRKIFLVDIGWLYEENREDDLRNGLEAFSTQMYVKSVLGSYKGFSGHAAYNRTNGAMLVPDNKVEEAMLIRRIPDELLVSDIQGAVWNYPLLKKGKITLKYDIMGEGLRLGLADFWINPSDPYAYERNIVTFELKDKTEKRETAEIFFDWENEKAELYIGGKLKETKNFSQKSCLGFCYLHIQALAEKEDRLGSLIKYVKAEKID